MSNGIQVPSEFFWRTKFFPTSWTGVFSQVWRRSIFMFCVYKFAEAIRYLKFKWEFVIIGRGCLVFTQSSSQVCVGGCCVLKLCKGSVPLVLNFLVLIRHPCVLTVSESLSSKHSNSWLWVLANSMLKAIDSLPMPYISLSSTWDCYAVFEAWCD